ncbi:hypothetical protein [Synechococcus sp. CCY 9618]|uniref:hypothetical protein n=1 Tax=Synechococcus sp. CCY 9618 TaxID=2815602 RepID=UPI001C24784B|nr:hypothetical protein [Synechococcus sp. CCY 9618]
MADDTNTPLPVGSGRRESPERSGRSGPNREPGGFRIRLSDNEMQAARALQEAFGLRSTVAVLGFALRTLADQLEKGQLEGLAAEHRAQAGSRSPAPRGGEPRRGGEGESRSEGRGGRGGARVDPFARPSKPPAPVEPSEPEPAEAEPQAEPGEEPNASAEPIEAEGDVTTSPEA